MFINSLTTSSKLRLFFFLRRSKKDMDTAYSIWILFLVCHLMVVESESKHLSSSETVDDRSKGRQLIQLLYSSILEVAKVLQKSNLSFHAEFFFKDHTSIMSELQFPDIKLPHLNINLF